MPKTKEVIISGRSFVLSERTARNVNKLISFSLQKTEKDYFDFVIEAAIILSDSLSDGLKSIPWYRFIKKYRTKKFATVENIVDTLAPNSETFPLAQQVYELEGILQDEKKKTVETVEESPSLLPSV